jgi:hypothetical protein
MGHGGWLSLLGTMAVRRSCAVGVILGESGDEPPELLQSNICAESLPAWGETRRHHAAYGADVIAEA